MGFKENSMKITPEGEMVRLEVVISKLGTKFKDTWLLESLRLVWELWSRLGWSTLSDNVLSKSSWTRLETNSEAERIMMAIERVLKVANYTEKYQLLAKMAMIGKDTENCDLLLEPSDEIAVYRKLVGRTLLEGIIDGMNITSGIPSDTFQGALENAIFNGTTRYQYKDSFYTEFVEDKMIGVLDIYFTCETHFEGIECFI